jgi:hypothetical protein
MTASVSNYTCRGGVRGAGSIPNSILRVGPSNVPDKGRLLMVSRAYLDSSGKPESQFLTLSSIVGTEQLWSEFEPLWENALAINKVPIRKCGVGRRFHMTDLFARSGDYEGWDETRERKLLIDLFNVLGKFRATRLRAYSCTVSMEDYRRAKLAIPNLRKPEAICVNYCVGGVNYTQEELSSPHPIELYFDSNEGFLHTINTIWQKEHKQSAGWANQIGCIVPVTDKYYPIQAADFLAGIVGRYHRGRDKWDGQWQMVTSQAMINHHVDLYDYAEIVEKYRQG